MMTTSRVSSHDFALGCLTIAGSVINVINNRVTLNFSAKVVITSINDEFSHQKQQIRCFLELQVKVNCHAAMYVTPFPYPFMLNISSSFLFWSHDSLLLHLFHT